MLYRFLLRRGKLKDNAGRVEWCSMERAGFLTGLNRRSRSAGEYLLEQRAKWEALTRQITPIVAQRPSASPLITPAFTTAFRSKLEQ